jgi:spore germination protein GerM
MRRRLAITCLVPIVLTAACRIGGSERVEEVDADLLSGLDEPSPATSTPSESDPTTSAIPGPTTTVATETVTLYFIEGSQLVAVRVETPEGTSTRGRLRLLEEGPPAERAEAGVRTALTPGLISGFASWGSDGATVTLDSEQFAGVENADQQLMIGQIVLSLTGWPGIERVDFTLDGEPMQVFLEDNTLSQPGAAVGRDDYAVLLAGEPPRTVESSRAIIEPSRSSVSLTSGP